MNSKAQGIPDKVSVVAVGIYQLLKTQNTFFVRTRGRKLFIVKVTVSSRIHLGNLIITVAKSTQKLFTLNTY